MKNNIMREVLLEKVTINICAGNDKQTMIKAKKLLENVTKKKPVEACAKRRLATWQIRPGLAIGYKVTLRGKEALEFLKWIIGSKDNIVKSSSLDNFGNFSIGIAEYLELSGMKYDADIGILGFETMATFARKGLRVKRRRIKSTKIPKRQKTKKEEVTDFLLKNKIEVK